MPASSRSRLILLWSGFVLAALATGLAVHRLYQTARQEIAAQSERALQQETARFTLRVQTATQEVRTSIIAELASFHVNGLHAALRQWDEANEFILGTFEWDPARGFLEGSVIPAATPTPETIASVWRDFRSWRTTHASATEYGPIKTDTWQGTAYRLADNPAFAASDLGYQSENLDLLRQENHRVDPWAGWIASENQPDAPWIFWYQTGPDEPVRSCFVDAHPLARQLRTELTNTAYARLELIANTSTHADSSALPGLPAYHLLAAPGDVFTEKSARTESTALIVALLFGVFLLGALALTLYTRRTAREAERKITFVTQVSHELRTPLTSIRLFADMLAEPGLAETKRIKFAGTISTESGRLGALIERLLAFNALEKTRRKITAVKIDVTALVRSTVEETEATLRTAGLAPQLIVPAEPVYALGDPSALKQAVLNLLDNAAKYAPASGPLSIEIVDRHPSILVRIADRGPGVPPAMRDQIFEPFVQGGQTLTDKSPGVGLGLSLARGMLRQAGGDLVLVQAATGAIFEIRLPRAETSPVS